MRYSLIAGLTCAALFANVTTVTAQSLMDVPSPIMPGSAPADAAAAPEAAAPKPKPKGPPGAVTIVNASAKSVTGVVLTAGDQTATLSKPLAPKERTAVKLPKMKGCTVGLVANSGAGRRMDCPDPSFTLC